MVLHRLDLLAGYGGPLRDRLSRLAAAAHRAVGCGSRGTHRLR